MGARTAVVVFFGRRRSRQLLEVRLGGGAAFQSVLRGQRRIARQRQALGVGSRTNADIPASAARTLCDQRNRPAGVLKLPEECRPFYELMQLAKLVPRE